MANSVEEFFDNFRANPELLAKLEGAHGELGKLLTEQAAAIVAGSQTMDEVAALFSPALDAVFEAKDLKKEDVFTLPDGHPLKDILYATLDRALFVKIQQQYVTQSREEVKEGQQWEAEGAVGEADGEDHTLE